MIKIEGLEGLEDIIKDMVDTDKIAAAMGKACALVEKEAKLNAPKDTGALRRSISSKVEVDGKEVIGTVFTPLEYAPYIEYGTGLFAESGGRKDVPWHYQDDKGEWHSTNGIHPCPFMRSALLDNRNRIKNILMRGMKND